MTSKLTSNANKRRRLLPLMGWPPLAEKGLESKAAMLGSLCLCINVFFFSYLSVVDPRSHIALLGEDNWIENFTAVFFLLAALLLFVTASLERGFFQRCMYIVGGLALAFFCGEEISWGQRIFGLATPDFLLDLNTQGELNLHNVRAERFDPQTLQYLALRHAGTWLSIAICAVFFCRKEALFRIPLPSILLVLGLMVAGNYHHYADYLNLRAASDPWWGIIVHEEKWLLSLLLLLGIYTLFCGQIKLFIATASTAAVFLASWYVNNHGKVNIALNEAREYLLSVVSLFYSLQLLLAQETARRKLAAYLHDLKPLGRWNSMARQLQRRPGNAQAMRSTPTLAAVRQLPGRPWLTTCSLVIVTSIGLMFFEYFHARKEVAAIKNAYQAILSDRSIEPVIRSDFDIYLIKNRLIYFKEPCASADTRHRKFFLHLMPADENDLLERRRRDGFNTLGFDFAMRGFMFDGKCLALVPLPRYAITSISTGQFTSSFNRTRRYKRFWTAEIHPPPPPPNPSTNRNSERYA